MRDDQLPTPAQMLLSADGEMDKAFAALQAAYVAFSDASDWLRSDWPPGCSLTDEQVQVKDRMFETIARGKRAINQLKNREGR